VKITRPANLLNVCYLSGYVAPRLDENVPARQAGRIAPPEGTGLGVSPGMGVLGGPVAVFDQHRETRQC
jgi:hypothetical protein